MHDAYTRRAATERVSYGQSRSPVGLIDDPATLKALGHTLRQELGGSSGPLYGVLFLRCGNVLERSASVGIAEWTEALEQRCRAISELGGAKPGDRTMLDALDPFVKALRRASANASREALLTAVDEAQKGADAHGSAQTLDNGDAERNGAAVSHGEKRLESRLLI